MQFREFVYIAVRSNARGPNQITATEESQNFRPRGFAPVKVTRFTKFTNERSRSFDRIYRAVTMPTTTLSMKYLHALRAVCVGQMIPPQLQIQFAKKQHDEMGLQNRRIVE